MDDAEDVLGGLSGITPGEWEADDDDGYGTWKIRGAEGRLTAQVFGDSAETDANALAISRVPDLIAEIRRLRGAMEDAGGYDL